MSHAEIEEADRLLSILEGEKQVIDDEWSRALILRLFISMIDGIDANINDTSLSRKHQRQALFAQSVRFRQGVSSIVGEERMVALCGEDDEIRVFCI